MATVANFLFFGGNFIMLPVLPLYLVSLGYGEGQVGLVLGVAALCAICVRLVAGPAVDRWGSAPFLLAGGLMFTVSTSLLLVARTSLAFVLLRLLHGAGLSVFTTAAGTLAANSVPPSRRAEGMGWFGLSGPVGMALAPAAGGFLLLHTGFKGTFSTAIVLAGLSWFTGFLIGRTGSRGRGEARGMTGHRTPSGTADASPPPASTPEPRPNHRWIAVSRGALFPSFVLSTVTFGFGGLTSFASLRATEVQLDNVGLFYTLLAVFQIAVRVATGRLADRWGRIVVVIPSMIVAITGFLLAAHTASAPAFLTAAALVGAAMGAVVPALSALAIDRAPRGERGSAMATFFGAFDVGVGSGSLIVGSIIEAFSFSAALSAAAGLAAAGLITLILVHYRRNKPRPHNVDGRGD